MICESDFYCSHWSNPSTCKKLCKCGHQCKDHYLDNDPISCWYNSLFCLLTFNFCKCKKFQNA